MAINMNNSDTPKGWKVCALPDFTRIVMGQSPSSETYNHNGQGMPFFQGKAEFGEIYPRIDKYCSEPNKIAKVGATLLSVRAPVGPTNLSQQDCCIGRGLAAIHPYCGIDPKFVLFLFRSIEPDISDKGTGSTFKAINKTFVEELEFALPPLNEQNRIVAKIEELFSELDKSIESLKTAQEQLRVYRQAVLKNAFEGKLTEEWREDNKNKLETANQLLARIKREREARYQQQLQEWEATVKMWKAKEKPGKKPPRPKQLKTIEHLDSSVIEKLPILPSGWHWVPLSWLLSIEKKPMTTGPFGTMLKKHEHQEMGVSVLGIENIGQGEFVKGNKIFVSEKKAEELQSFEVEPGEIIISRSGTVGEICEVPEGLGKTLISTNLLRVSLNQNVILSPFFVFVFQGGGSVKSQVNELCKGSSRDFLNQSILQSIVFPLCSLAEQIEVTKQISSKLSRIERLSDDIEENLVRLEALRRSILKKAFSGQLVAQDPSDEPASVLLERIKPEKAGQEKNEKKNKRRDAA